MNTLASFKMELGKFMAGVAYRSRRLDSMTQKSLPMSP